VSGKHTGENDMKVFKFNPKTGKRGEQICEIKRPDGMSFDYDRTDVVVPSRYQNRDGDFVEWRVAYMIQDRQCQEIDLGDEWVCFCTGYTTGLSDSQFARLTGQARPADCTPDFSKEWEWVIYPPTSLRKQKAA
jgi:hypothetical protein